MASSDNSTKMKNSWNLLLEPGLANVEFLTNKIFNKFCCKTKIPLLKNISWNQNNSLVAKKQLISRKFCEIMWKYGENDCFQTTK